MYLCVKSGVCLWLPNMLRSYRFCHLASAPGITGHPMECSHVLEFFHELDPTWLCLTALPAVASKDMKI